MTAAARTTQRAARAPRPSTPTINRPDPAQPEACPPQPTCASESIGPPDSIPIRPVQRPPESPDAAARRERLSALLSGAPDLDAVAAALGLTLDALLAWASAPDSGAMLRAVRRLSDDRAELIASKARSGAAHRLLELALHAASEEVARKACVDLLRFRDAPAHAAASTAPGADGDHHERAPGTTATSTDAADPRTLLEELEALREYSEGAD